MKITISIATLLLQKGSTIYSVSDDATVEEAVHEMNLQKIGSILVLKARKLIGIFTERDVLVRVVATGLDPQTTPVTQVMTRDVQTISPETSVEDAMAIITGKRCRHLPVEEKGRLVGLISAGDITRWIVQIHQMEAENLRQYLTGSYPS